MCTINDFFVYEMVLGWSTYEKLAYLYCMDINNNAFTLINDGETFIFNCHKRFLSHYQFITT